MWVIALGQTGLVGMASLFLVLLMPPLFVTIRLTPRAWAKASTAPIACMAVALNLYALDMLLNPAINPIFMLMAGGISAFSGMKAESGGTAKAAIRESRTPVS